MFTPEERARIRGRVFELARSDPRASGGALTGSASIDAEDEWSDVDTSFGIADGADPRGVLDDWTAELDRELHLSTTGTSCASRRSTGSSSCRVPSSSTSR